MTISWVVGSTGLLGAALCRALNGMGGRRFAPSLRFSWHDGAQLVAEMDEAISQFADALAECERWEIYWAAGTGTMGSSADSLRPETEALSFFLRSLQAILGSAAKPGTIVFASSAGAIYAGSSEDIVTEDSRAAPTTAYGREKLTQEELVRGFVSATGGTTALIARLSTLYGQGQAHGKKQGLLGQMARSILQNRPIQIYVPYDTIRDYIDVDDAARLMVGIVRTSRESQRVLVKIIASEAPATVAEIISVFKRLARRSPRIVVSASRLSSLYSRRIQFRSIVPTDFSRLPVKRLPVGIAQLLMAERLEFNRGRPRQS